MHFKISNLIYRIIYHTHFGKITSTFRIRKKICKCTSSQTLQRVWYTTRLFSSCIIYYYKICTSHIIQFHLTFYIPICILLFFFYQQFELNTVHHKIYNSIIELPHYYSLLGITWPGSYISIHRLPLT